MSNKKIWSLPLVLVTALLLVGLFAATVFAQTPSVPSTMTAVVSASGTTIAYEVSNPPTAAADDTGTGAIEAAVVTTWSGVTATGAAISESDLPTAEAAFAEAAGGDPANVSISTGELTAGATYTVKLIAVYDTDREDAAEDNAATTDVFEDGRTAPDTADNTDDNDQDGQLRTTLTIHVPSVPGELSFQVDPTKVVNGEIISRVGNDRTNDPLTFEVSNLGDEGSITVALANPDGADANVSYKVVRGNEIEVRSAVNNLAAGTYNATITVNGGDFDLDDEDETFELEIDAVVAAVDSLTFDDDNDSANTLPATGFPDDDGIHYTVTIPETTATDTGVLPYYVRGGADAVDGTEDINDIAAEQITGTIGGTSSHLFSVNNTTMAITYIGPTGGLTAGQEHLLRLTASGDTGLANRLIVGMAKITVADVDTPPSNPGAQVAEIVENDVSETGLVKIKDGTDDIEVLVKDFDGIASDDETASNNLKFRVATTPATEDFKFDGTKLLVNAAILRWTLDDNPATTGVTEDDWPDDPPAGWSFAESPVTSRFPDLTRKVKVTVSDGVPSNDQTFDLTITLKVNTPPMTTPDVMKDATSGDLSYSGMAMVDDDARGESILDLSDVVTDVQGDLMYTIHPMPAAEGQPANTLPPELAVGGGDSAGNIVLLFVPSGLEMKTYNFMLRATDGYNPAPETAGVIDDDALDAEVEVTIEVTIMRPDRAYPTLRLDVDEQSTGPVEDDNGNAISVSSQIAGATEWEIIGSSGADGSTAAMMDGTLDFAVDPSTGVVSVVQARDHDIAGAILNPSLTVSASNDDGDDLGNITVIFNIQGINEKPSITTTDNTAFVTEDSQDGHAVMTGDSENDVAYQAMATDPEDDSIRWSIEGSDGNSVPFVIDGSGNVTVSGNNQLDHETKGSYSVVITASDGSLDDTLAVTIEVGNENEAPEFVGALLEADVHEDEPVGYQIADYEATDIDGDVLTFSLKNQDDTTHFNLDSLTGVLTIAQSLDYETQRVHLVEINVTDTSEATAEIQLTVNVINVNDEEPDWNSAPVTALTVLENTVRGTTLENYSATDKDGQAVTYSLGGNNADSFSIDTSGNLKTLESLDADRQVPCGAAGCSVTVIATDVANDNVVERDEQKSKSVPVRITVSPVEDSVSTLDVSKANPVPGTQMGNPMSALSNAKTGGDEYLWNMLDCAGMLDLVDASDTKANRDAYCVMWDDLSDAAEKRVSDALDRNAPAESPYDLPATEGSSPMNFVETEWANWGTVLRIEVTAESPQATCGDGNECVVVNVNSDSADDKLKLKAYRVDTPAGSASKENHFVAALMLVELSSDATPGDAAVYKHNGGMVPALKVDEEDEVEVEFGNLRDTIDVENEAPEVSNFTPEHERAFDDADVDYKFTITDDTSGLPEPEDLPDGDGDENYTPVVALISKSSGGVGQCWVSKDAPKDAAGVVIKGAKVAAHIHEDDTLYCPGTEQKGEYIASKGGFGFAPIRDDKDFDETDNGYDVETTIVLTENDTYYVTFIVCDKAGNCAYHDPDGNDDAEELAQITVDTEDPVFVEARTGLNWDSTDNEYDDDRNYIQVIFNDLTTLNPATVEVDDFVVEGHSIVSVTVYENPDDDDVTWADSGRYAQGGGNNKRHMNEYRDLENVVFIELEDELLADETPDVTIVPNGVEDSAGNEQDDGDHEADDWISPSFTIVSITSTLETEQDEVLAGDGDEITLVVTADERLDQTRPTVMVTYVNAASGSVDTKGTATCKAAKDPDDKLKWTGTRDRGEIVNGDNCQNISGAKGGTLNNSVEKVSNTEWIVTVTEPKDTGYYNFRISGEDRSPQENPGSEGIAADSIVTDFFDSDGDVNVDDAVFWEGDINLSNPNVRVSGNVITDNEPDIEFRSPLFVEIDFTRNHWSEVDCKGEGNDNVLANCMNENSEYAEDNFDDIVITMFELDGVDMTDSVKTTDAQTFLVTLENVALGDHTARIQATDVAGNTLEDVLEIDFEVSDRDPFERRLNPGWNLVSLPGEPADSSIGSVFGAGVEVRTVYTYDPVVPGGWMVAVRETLDADWQGDLTEITGSRGYWVLSDAIQDWEVSIPRLAGGAAGTGTPIQPPVIPLYAGWNLIPVTDISGNGEGGQTVSADVYLQNLDDGLDLARVLGFDTIRNQWVTVLDPDMQMNNTLRIGDAYWIFVREAASLVPSGYTGGGGSD